MAARKLLKDILFPVDLHACIFDAEAGATRRAGAIAAGALAVEAWIFVIALQYWWWGQVYIKTGLLVFGALYFVLTLPAALVTWSPSRTFQWHATILFVPTLVAIACIILLRIGVIEPASAHYLYRVTGLMIAAGGCIAWALAWKIAGHFMELKDNEPTVMEKVRAATGLIVDVACIAAFALLLLNIEWIVASLRAAGFPF